MFETLTIEDDGKVSLPDSIQARYGFKPSTPVRVIETQSGVLLVPLIDEPMSDQLQAELEDWQALGLDSLSLFPYRETLNSLTGRQ